MENYEEDELTLLRTDVMLSLSKLDTVVKILDAIIYKDIESNKADLENIYDIVRSQLDDLKMKFEKLEEKLDS